MANKRIDELTESTEIFTTDWLPISQTGNLTKKISLGTLYASVPIGSGTPSGSDTFVQFNDSGAFGSDSSFYFNKTTNTLYSDYFIGNGAGVTNVDALTADTADYALDSDLWDNHQFADYLNQPLLTTSTPSFASLILSSNPSIISSAYTINIKPSNYTSTYLQFYTQSIIGSPTPHIKSVGSGQIRILSDGAYYTELFLQNGSNYFSIATSEYYSHNLFYSMGDQIYKSTGSISFCPDSDNDDYITISTTANVPQIRSVGSDLIIKTDEGLILTSMGDDTKRLLIYWEETGDIIKILSDGTTNLLIYAEDNLYLQASSGLIDCDNENLITTGIIKATSFGILEGGLTPTKYTYFQCGDQSIDLTYTLPIAYPSVTGYVLSCTDAGVMSWVAQSGGGYTDEQAQDAIGTILTDSTTIDFTYDDGTPSITATILPNGITIGTPTDSSWADGLFSTWTSSTKMNDAIDDINEVLLGLAPPPAPALDNISTADSGVEGKICWGTSHTISGYSNVSTEAGGAALDVNGTFVNSGQRKGIFVATNVFNGTLNDDVTAHTYSYPADSFGNGDNGTLKLYVNGSLIHSVDLSTFGSGASVNGNGSGFNLSTADSCHFPDGTHFALFKYRTGTYTIAVADQRNGWNYMRVVHTLVSGDINTNYYEWVYDADTTATSYASMSISGLSMTGSAYLSGVQYHTGGTATYNCTISNHHLKTYSSSASAITFPTTTNCSVSSLAVNAIDSPNWENKTQVLAQTITVDTGRILDADIAVSTATDRTVQTDATSSTTSGGYELLVDTNISGASGQSDTAESWNAEGYRQRSNLSLTDTGYATGPGNGPADWDSTVSLVSATAGYSDGLLVYNGSLYYPTQGAESGNFSGVLQGPAGNPNYSAASGNRVYLRYFYVGSGKQNFNIALTVTSTSFVSVATGPSGNNCTMEILAPNTTQNGSAVVEFKDAVTAYTNNDAIGCYAATYGGTIPTNWGITLGTRSTATSGNVIVMRFTASSAWTGSLGALTLTVL